MKTRSSKFLSPIFVIVLTVFIDITGYGIIIPLLPFYAEEFQAGPTALGILIASFALMQFFFSPILGKASDKKGRKPIILISLLISLISFTFFSFASSYIMLLISRLIAGIATERAIAQAYIADITDEKNRTKQMGKIGAAFGAGFILGPAISGPLSTYGYTIPGYTAMALTIINIFFVLTFLPEPKNKKQEITKNSGYFSDIRNSLKKPFFGSTLSILFIVTLAFSTIPVIVPLLSIDFFNFTSLEFSIIFVYIGIIQIIMQGFLINSLSRRLGEEKLIVLGPILMATGMILMPIFNDLIIFFITNGMLAAGFGLINTSIPAFLSKRSSKQDQGSILGAAGSIASISNVPGPLIIGLIYDLMGSFIPFLISSLMLILAFLIGCKVFGARKIQKERV